MKQWDRTAVHVLQAEGNLHLNTPRKLNKSLNNEMEYIMAAPSHIQSFELVNHFLTVLRLREQLQRPENFFSTE